MTILDNHIKRIKMKTFLISLAIISFFLIALELHDLNTNLKESIRINQISIKFQGIDLAGKYCKLGANYNTFTGEFNCK